MDECVTGTVKVSNEDVREAERVEMDINAIMRLVDLIFLSRDDSHDIPS